MENKQAQYPQPISSTDGSHATTGATYGPVGPTTKRKPDIASSDLLFSEFTMDFGGSMNSGPVGDPTANAPDINLQSFNTVPKMSRPNPNGLMSLPRQETHNTCMLGQLLRAGFPPQYLVNLQDSKKQNHK